MKVGTRAESTALVSDIAPLVSTLDLLDCVTFKELKAAHYRIAAETHEARERAVREFRTKQPSIYVYLPYAPPTPRAVAGENALIFSFARHFCAAMEARLGSVPVLKAEDPQATELRAQTMLAHGPTPKQVEKLRAVQFALGGILSVHYFGGIGVIPDRQRVLLKVLTLLQCFSGALNRPPITQSSHSPTIYTRP
jgi:hypothetical protein